MRDELLTIAEVVAMTRLSKSTIYRRIGEGSFPRSLKISGCTRWRRSDVERWIAALQ